MRAIHSGIALAQDLDTALAIYWPLNRDLYAPFRLLFEPIDSDLATLYDGLRFRPVRFVATHPHLFRFFQLFGKPDNRFSEAENDRLKVLDFGRALSNGPLVIESYAQFYPVKNALSVFTPITALQDRIDRRVEGFDAHTIGVHIRRTDNIKSIQRSPDRLFIERMHQEIAREPGVTFYLATDSMEVKTMLKNEFGDRIITTPLKASRTTVEGVQEAVVELYTLAATSKILGSHWSSYSSSAGQIGKIPVEKVVE